MTLLKILSIPAAATLAFSLVGACAQTDDVDSQSTQVSISDPFGAEQIVTVYEAEVGPSDGHAQVGMDGRDFSIVQWIDADSGAKHSVVSASDSEVSYEYIGTGIGAEIVLTDATGSRVIADGDALGTIDEAAATLLMNVRPSPGTADEVAYSFRQPCVGYDTSDPDDWHFYVTWCICDHWYSLFACSAE